MKFFHTQLILLLTIMILVFSLGDASGQSSPGAIFKGTDILMLKQNQKFKVSDVRIMTGDTDSPAAVAKDATEGSLYIQDGTGVLFQKQDTGLTANWLPLLIGPSASGTDECVSRWDGTGTPQLQDSIFCITDLGAGTGLTQLTVDNIDINTSTILSSSGSVIISPSLVVDNLTLDATTILSSSGTVIIDPALGIGGSVDSSSVLHVQSTTKGVIEKPLMTTIEKNAISSPGTGLGVYDTDLLQEQKYNGSEWKFSYFKDITYDPAFEIEDNGTVDDIDDFQEIYNHIQSSGLLQGGGLTDNGDGTIDIAACQGMLRATPDPHTALYHVSTPAQAALSLTDNSTNYVYWDYNTGTPNFAVSTSESAFNCIDKCLIYVITREGTDLTVIDAREQNVDGNRKTRRRFLHTRRYEHKEGSTAIGEIGTRNVSVTSGSFYFMMNELTHDAFDTSVAGTANVNVFTYYYYDGAAWVKVASSKAIDNTQYNDTAAGLTAMTNNRYKTEWVYLIHGSPTSMAIVYSPAQYTSIADAQAAGTPALLPPFVSGTGSLIGRIIQKKSATGFELIETAFGLDLTTTTATIHNGSSGLQGGTTDEYYHLTSAAEGNLVSQDQEVYTTSSPTFVAATLSGFTQNSIIFAGAGGLLSENNTNLFWNNSTNTLAVTGIADIDEVQIDGGTISTDSATNLTFAPGGTGTILLNLQGGQSYQLETAATNLMYLQGQPLNTEVGFIVAPSSADAGDDATLGVRGSGQPGGANVHELLSQWDASEAQYELNSTCAGTATCQDLSLSTGTNANQIFLDEGTGFIHLGGSGPATMLTVAGDLSLESEGEARFLDSAGGQYMAFKAPATVTSSTTMTLPNGGGTSGQILETSGGTSPVLSWVDKPAGTVTESLVAYYTSSYTVASGSELVIDFSTSEKDTDSRVSGTGASWVYTVSTAASYRLCAEGIVTGGAFAENDIFYLRARVNGSSITSGLGYLSYDRASNTTVQAWVLAAGCTDLPDLSASDTISVVAFQNSGANRTFGARISISEIVEP